MSAAFSFTSTAAGTVANAPEGGTEMCGGVSRTGGPPPVLLTPPHFHGRLIWGGKHYGYDHWPMGPLISGLDEERGVRVGPLRILINQAGIEEFVTGSYQVHHFLYERPSDTGYGAVSITVRA